MRIGTRKMKALMAAYAGFAGTRTMSAVLNQIPQPLADSLTGKQLGAVASLLFEAYNNGRGATGASIEDDCVWIEPLKALVPLDDIRKRIPECLEVQP